MTKKRNDTHSTEFGLWLREQKALDSSLGFTATNIDYIWMNYKTGHWMIIEEKRYGSGLSHPQKRIFNTLHNAAKAAAHVYKGKSFSKYKGFHVIVFEKTSAQDGRIFLDKKEIDKQKLIDFLSFDENFLSE
jgi:hypothetical protein